MNRMIASKNYRNQLVANHHNKKANWAKIANVNKNQMVHNAVSGLQYDDFKELTDDVVKIREFETVGNFYRSFVGAGLTRSMDIGKTVIDYQNANDFGDATVSMDMANRETEQNNYNQVLVPLPIFHKDFTIPWRQTGFSYKESDGVMLSQFKVMETRDKVLLLGDSSIKVNGSELFGYTNHPATIQDPGGISDWSLQASATLIYDEMVGLISDLFEGAKVGSANSVQPWVASDILTNLQRKSSATKSNDLTVMQDLANISQLRGVQMHQDLPPGAVLLVEMSPRTSDLAIASDVIAMPWQRLNDAEDMRFTIMAACTPRIKQDRAGNTGILFATKS